MEKDAGGYFSNTSNKQKLLLLLSLRGVDITDFAPWNFKMQARHSLQKEVLLNKLTARVSSVKQLQRMDQDAGGFSYKEIWKWASGCTRFADVQSNTKLLALQTTLLRAIFLGRVDYLSVPYMTKIIMRSIRVASFESASKVLLFTAAGPANIY